MDIAKNLICIDTSEAYEYYVADYFNAIHYQKLNKKDKLPH